MKQYSEPGGKTVLLNRDINAAINISLIYISLRDKGVIPYRFRVGVTLKDEDYRPKSCGFTWKHGPLNKDNQETFVRSGVCV